MTPEMPLAIRPLGYLWALPNTVLGLCFVPVALLTGGKVRRNLGAIEVHGGFVEYFLSKMLYINAGAMTLGHVILGQNPEMLDRCRKHEHVHIRLDERFGPFIVVHANGRTDAQPPPRVLARRGEGVHLVDISNGDEASQFIVFVHQQ